MKTKKIDEYEVTYPIKAKTYKEILKKCPKGFRIPEIWELIKIHLKSNIIKNHEKGKWLYFWSSTIDDSGVRGLCLDYDGRFGKSWGEDFDESGAGCRVIYIKDDKEYKKSKILAGRGQAP